MLRLAHVFSLLSPNIVFQNQGPILCFLFCFPDCSVTYNGYECQEWSSQSPREHQYTPENYPNAGLGDHNFCRRPDKDPSGLWCIVTDPNHAVGWDWCDIENCPTLGKTRNAADVSSALKREQLGAVFPYSIVYCLPFKLRYFNPYP